MIGLFANLFPCQLWNGIGHLIAAKENAIKSENLLQRNAI